MDVLKQWLTPKAVFYVVLGIVGVILISKGLQYVNGLKNEKDRLYTELIGQKQAYEQLSAKAAKLEIDYKNQTDLRAEAEKRFANEKSALEEHIKVLADATFLINEKAREEKNSDIVYAGTPGQTGWVMDEVKFNNGPAVGYVLIMNDGRVTSKMYNHQIKINMVVSKDETTGRYSVVSKADYILKAFPINTGGANWVNKPYPLDIVGGTAIIDPTEPLIYPKHFQWWNPKLNLNADIDVNGFAPGLGISLMGYGRTLDDVDFKFAQFGLDIENQTPRATFTPVLWRPFDGFISNTYIGPGVSLSPSKAFGYFLGIQVGL